ncbi:hydroxyisourate hydrolase [Congregibacter litoralis]|uniref:5-hydroxyisourate hydrolase n=1 Tax=Congregibacter litoralis KT71 TaxID=314285 RepID=A4A380_9GAMM|nr:hydroxyisourate hydrolase [Congregibacter litoralis]EAQ99153.1 hydroxyisourate hydrolase [Congregibacter litoralis KT71]
MSQITTHILDTARGCPAAGVPLALFHRQDSDWVEIASGTTNEDGRVAGLLDGDRVLPAGTYRMHFATGGYFSALDLNIFYPYVDVVFNLDDGGEHYHIPLLLSPFGYSTYRGS